MTESNTSLVTQATGKTMIEGLPSNRGQDMMMATETTSEVGMTGKGLMEGKTHIPIGNTFSVMEREFIERIHALIRLPTKKEGN